MQQSPKINHRKIFQKILNITFISLLIFWKNNNDLPRPKPKRQITPELILVIIVILIMIILPLALYAAGCMESTTYYNRGLI